MAAAGWRDVPRQTLALVACGIRRRGLATTGGTRSGVWAEGCRLAALVLFVATASASMYPLAVDTWYSRLGFVWPRTPFTPAPPMGAGALARSILAALLPLLGAAAVCRGRSVIAIACSILTAGLFLAGEVGSGIQVGQYYQLGGQEWLANAYKLGDAIVLAAPAALLCAGLRRRTAAAHSLLWLAVPGVIGVLCIGYFLTSITFWPLGALMLAWFLAAPLSPHLAVAAFATAVPIAVYLVPTAVGQAATYEYSIAVCAGAVVLALAALARAMALAGDARLQTPPV
jgi:hypothetical protein